MAWQERHSDSGSGVGSNLGIGRETHWGCYKEILLGDKLGEIVGIPIEAVGRLTWGTAW